MPVSSTHIASVGPTIIEVSGDRIISSSDWGSADPIKSNLIVIASAAATISLPNDGSRLIGTRVQIIKLNDDPFVISVNGNGADVEKTSAGKFSEFTWTGDFWRSSGSSGLSVKIGGAVPEQVIDGTSTYQKFIELPSSSGISFGAEDYGIWMIFANIELGIPSNCPGSKIKAIVNHDAFAPSPFFEAETRTGQVELINSLMPDTFTWSGQGEVERYSKQNIISVSNDMDINWYIGQSQNSLSTDAIVVRNATLYALRIGDL